MKVYDNGRWYKVSVSAREIQNFNRRWPCSELRGTRGIWFEFDKRNGDLVGHNARPSEEGSALLALSQDAQAYGAKLLRGTPGMGGCAPC